VTARFRGNRIFHIRRCLLLPESPSRASVALNPYLSAAELAVLLRTTVRGIYARLHRGGLPKPRRIGRKLLFNRKEVLAWIESARG
jgi:excisionase family DNA binding protein